MEEPMRYIAHKKKQEIVAKSKLENLRVKNCVGTYTLVRS
jgi:hypothetical protein